VDSASKARAVMTMTMTANAVLIGWHFGIALIAIDI
tara:strand:+ start:513 stop:620 length:108 start_codon:yes stop_codon:yes gene_type:complete